MPILVGDSSIEYVVPFTYTQVIEFFFHPRLGEWCAAGNAVGKHAGLYLAVIGNHTKMEIHPFLAGPFGFWMNCLGSACGCIKWHD